MSTDTKSISIQGLRVEVVRKDIKNLHLGVYPPNGRVRVAAPTALGDEAVRLAVINKLGWIKKQRRGFQSQARQSQREYVSGESHYFLGRRYRLRVHEIEGRQRVEIRSNTYIELYARPDSDQVQRERVVLAWYRERLRDIAEPLITKWQKKLKVMADDWGIRRMKTKWGSCNAKARRIWINLELIKKPIQCLEYIIVHELIHLIEPKHGERFAMLMDKRVSNWRQLRDELNAVPLAHDEWAY